MQVAAKDPQQKELEFERRPVAFNGELAFTSMLLALANPQPLKAYFLQGHGEPSLTDSGNIGYQKFASVLGAKLRQRHESELGGHRRRAGGLQPADHRRRRPRLERAGAAAD